VSARASGGARLPEADAAKLRDTARVVGWGLGIYAAVAIVAAYLKQNATGSLAVQAVVVEFGAGRLAVAWSDAAGPVPSVASIARRAASGALLGALAAAGVLAFATVTHAATLATTSPTPSMLAVGLLTAGLVAMRDELLLRGVVLRAFQRSAPASVGLVVCGLAAVAVTLGTVAGTDGDTASALASAAHQSLVAAPLAVCFAVLWKKDRGAWLAWGAHTAWLWTTGPVARGGLLDLRWAAGPWGGGDVNASSASAAALGVVLIGALAWYHRRQ